MIANLPKTGRRFVAPTSGAFWFASIEATLDTMAGARIVDQSGERTHAFCGARRVFALYAGEKLTETEVALALHRFSRMFRG